MVLIRVECVAVKSSYLEFLFASKMLLTETNLCTTLRLLFGF